MNLNELWSGTDYAYYEYKGRGELYRANARRVKVIRAFKEKQIGNERLSGFAEVMYCDTETGEPKTNSFGDHIIDKVRARDIAMRWEEYEEIHARRVAERERQEQERRERRERAAEEERRLEEIERQKKEQIMSILETHGIKRELVYNITSQGVHLSRAGLEREFQIV